MTPASKLARITAAYEPSLGSAEHIDAVLAVAQLCASILAGLEAGVVEVAAPPVPRDELIDFADFGAEADLPPPEAAAPVAERPRPPVAPPTPEVPAAAAAPRPSKPGPERTVGLEARSAALILGFGSWPRPEPGAYPLGLLPMPLLLELAGVSRATAVAYRREHGYSLEFPFKGMKAKILRWDLLLHAWGVEAARDWLARTKGSTEYGPQLLAAASRYAAADCIDCRGRGGSEQLVCLCVVRNLPGSPPADTPPPRHVPSGTTSVEEFVAAGGQIRRVPAGELSPKAKAELEKIKLALRASRKGGRA